MVKATPPDTWLTGISSERWSELTACVVAPSFLSTALAMPAASGVPTWTVVP